jgi:inorganic pyrophosphatase
VRANQGPVRRPLEPIPAAGPPTVFDRLPSRHRKTGGYLAVIEATQGSRNKMKYDTGLGVFGLHAVLPLGTAFPYDFGFIPGTLGDDGDPLDVLVFMDEPAPVATIAPCRLVGVIEATQTREGRRVRNDRLLAVALHSHRYERCRSLRDIGREVLEEIELSLQFYNAQKGARFKPLRRSGPRRAKALVAQGERRFLRAARTPKQSR